MKVVAVLVAVACFSVSVEASNVICGAKTTSKSVTVEDGNTFSFKTQKGRKYKGNTECTVDYKMGDTCAKMSFVCTKFNTNNKDKRRCSKGDKVTVTANGKSKAYCKTKKPKVVSTGDMSVVFTSDTKKHGTGAVCKVKCTEAAGGGTGSVLPLSDSANIAKWNLRSDLSDEFSGSSLNTKKWRPIWGPEWPGRAPSQFSRANVNTDGGFLKITTKRDPDFTYSKLIDNDCLAGQGDTCCLPARAPENCGYYNWTTGYVESRKTLTYGYVETRSKSANASVTSSFWLNQAEDKNKWESGEIDVFEQLGAPIYDKGAAKKYPMDTHCHKAGTASGNVFNTSVNLADDFHVFGLEWDPEYLAFYFDGNEVYRLLKSDPNKHWCFIRPMQIIFDSEFFWWHGHPTDESLPAVFEIDYVRAWQK